jgi:hypothetical protein
MHSKNVDGSIQSHEGKYLFYILKPSKKIIIINKMAFKVTIEKTKTPKILKGLKKGKTKLN